MNGGIFFRYTEPRQQATGISNSRDDTFEKQDVRLDDFRPILVAGPYFRV